MTVEEHLMTKEALKTDLEKLKKFDGKIHWVIEMGFMVESVMVKTCHEFFDELVNQIMAKLGLSEPLMEDFLWFVYEHDFGRKSNWVAYNPDITIGGKEYKIDSIDDFVEYAKKEWGIE